MIQPFDSIVTGTKQISVSYGSKCTAIQRGVDRSFVSRTYMHLQEVGVVLYDVLLLKEFTQHKFILYYILQATVVKH